MKLLTPWTKALTSALAAAALCAALPAAQAQEAYPNKPVRLLVGVGPGSTVDTSARVVAEALAKLLGQAVVVENQPGAAGMVAARNVTAARPDGYTLLYYFTDSIAIAPLLSKEAPFDPQKDLAYVGDLVRTYGVVLTVPATSPVKTYVEFAQLAKSSPKKLNYGTWGMGSSAQLGFEMVGDTSGFEMVHIPYKSGSASYVGALGGEVDIVMSVVSAAPVRSGRLRPIAVAGKRRVAEYPDVPTFAELGLPLQAFAPVAYGIAAPKGTPAAILDKLRAAAEKVVSAPDNLERFKIMGVEAALSKPADVIADIQRANASYGPIIKRLGITTQ